ncbi:GtrA family protein [Streptomyces odontomachi]|uniref:GtrA family protein n=1 Tax=Streptomyces odontomachi TaxID=2944940 RepID=UPI00210DD8CB|nr:GtrA family protein [Streptomyces sp. ODS25]
MRGTVRGGRGEGGGLGALGREITKFGVVGGLGLVVNFGVFNLFRLCTPLSTVQCGLAGTGVAVVVNYLGYRYFTYRDRDKSGVAREFSLFVLFSAASLTIENGGLYAALHWFGWDTALQDNLVKALGIAVATVFRFWSYRTWVFRLSPPAEEPT